MKKKIVSFSIVKRGDHFITLAVYTDGTTKELPQGHPDIAAYMREREKLARKQK